MKLTGLDHIGVYTPDLEKCVCFYRDVLGFALSCRQVGTRADGSSFNMAFMQCGSCIIELVDAPKGFEASDGTVAHIAIACDDVDEVFAALKAKGIEIEWAEPKTEAFFDGRFRHFFMRGPAGERLEFCSML